MKILCVIDMQKDFIDGALGTPEAQAIKENVAAEIALWRKNGDKVIFTRDTHEENYINTMEGKNLPVPHCIKGTPGWEIDPGLNSAGDKIIDKPTFGSFELCRYIDSLGEIEEIELVGLCTDICVISNALLLKAAFHELPIKVKASCCAGVTPQSHNNALESMKMCQIEII